VCEGMGLSFPLAGVANQAYPARSVRKWFIVSAHADCESIFRSSPKFQKMH